MNKFAFVVQYSLAEVKYIGFCDCWKPCGVLKIFYLYSRGCIIELNWLNLWILLICLGLTLLIYSFKCMNRLSLKLLSLEFFLIFMLGVSTLKFKIFQKKNNTWAFCIYALCRSKKCYQQCDKYFFMQQSLFEKKKWFVMGI